MKIKILSWNVNGLRAVERKKILPQFLETYQPDFFFTQEIKGNAENFSDYLNNHPDYQVYYNSAIKKGYAGTGVWVKKEIIKENNNFKIKKFETGIYTGDNDEEGRVCKVFVEYWDKSNKKKISEPKTYCFMGIYFPNGGKSQEAWEKKLLFYDDFLKEATRLQKSGIECIWCGDVNCAHNKIDLARPQENDGLIGFHPRERAWMDRVVEKGWVDIWRKKFPQTKNVYSWWSMITRSRDKNIGWRIDYFFCYHTFFEKIISINYLNEQMGSDHCPVVLEFSL